jgi:hypothetical protein
MRRALTLGVVVLAVCLAGCVPSVFPFYTAADVRFDPALVGEWREAGSADETWTFAKAQGNAYTLIIREKQKGAPFVVHLFRLGTRQFLDMTPDPDGLKDADLLDVYKAALIPGHFLARVSQITPALKMAFLDPKWIKAYLHDHPAEVAHALDSSADVILTASTRSLQTFMTVHGGQKGVFGEESDLRKK